MLERHIETKANMRYVKAAKLQLRKTDLKSYVKTIIFVFLLKPINS
jgi:hypothetical protein